MLVETYGRCVSASALRGRRLLSEGDRRDRLLRGVPVRLMARQLGRSPSSISASCVETRRSVRAPRTGGAAACRFAGSFAASSRPRASSSTPRAIPGRPDQSISR